MEKGGVIFNSLKSNFKKEVSLMKTTPQPVTCMGDRISSAGSAALARRPGRSLGRRVLDNWQLYALLLVPVILTFVYKYIPMYGIQIAFRDFKASRGYLGSEWVGWYWFQRFFSSPTCWRMIKNTVLISLFSLLWSFPIPIILSLIIYLATLANVDPGLYEAAKIDGASVFQRILNIDIPELLPMAILNLIMAAGGLMNVGFEKVWLLQTDLNKAASDVIAVYVYQQGIESAKYSYSTAVGLFNTAVNIVLLLIVNKIASKASDVEFV